MQWDRKAIASQNHELWKNGVLTFSTREELIISAANILALDYLENLEFWRCTAMDDTEETMYWNGRIAKEVAPYRDALKKELEAEAEKKWFGRTKNKIRIDFRHRKLIDLALRTICREGEEQCGIGSNVTYVLKLKECQLQKIIR